MNVTKIAITGSGGFLGWHTLAALQEQGADVHPFSLGDKFDLEAATAAVDGADRVIHVAGVNRASEDEVRDGNVSFAKQVAEAVRAAATPPAAMSYANSTQVGNGSVYGHAKEAAASVLSDLAQETGSSFTNVLLPNLFGEHGRPFYNAVTATFAHKIAAAETPEVQDDKELTLLHAQDAADLLTGAVEVSEMPQLVEPVLVSELRDRLLEQAQIYRTGEIPDVATPFARNLFNTYRSYVVDQLPVVLTRHADARGSFFEIIRTHGGPGQSSFSKTVPGVTRGDHFHRRKIERFTVLSGTATINLRKLGSSEVLSFEVDGENPVSIDMPTMWSHNIVNTGDELLYTSFWTNDIFDPTRPDTIPEVV